MSASLEFLSEAKAEAEEAARYYEEQIPGLGTRFQGEFENVCTAIVRDPLLWRKRSGDYRRVNLKGFPYYVTFFIRGDRIIVTAIGHASRQPEYWRQRKF